MKKLLLSLFLLSTSIFCTQSINNDSQDTQSCRQEEFFSMPKERSLFKKIFMQSLIENSSSHIPKKSVLQIITEHYQKNK